MGRCRGLGNWKYHCFPRHVLWHRRHLRILFWFLRLFTTRYLGSRTDVGPTMCEGIQSAEVQQACLNPDSAAYCLKIRQIILFGGKWSRNLFSPGSSPPALYDGPGSPSKIWWSRLLRALASEAVIRLFWTCFNQIQIQAQSKGRTHHPDPDCLQDVHGTESQPNEVHLWALEVFREEVWVLCIEVLLRRKSGFSWDNANQSCTRRNFEQHGTIPVWGYPVLMC
jgi:hypothetical protein